MSTKEKDGNSIIEQAVRREAQKRFGRELGRWGVANVSQFALDMIRLARDTEAKGTGTAEPTLMPYAPDKKKE